LAIPRIAERIKASEVERAMVSATGRVVRHSKNADVHRNFAFSGSAVQQKRRRSRQTRAGSRDLSAHHFVESKMYDIFTLPAPQPRVSLWHGATKMTTLAASR
jgi:hypothetical protein